MQLISTDLKALPLPISLRLSKLTLTSSLELSLYQASHLTVSHLHLQPTEIPNSSSNRCSSQIGEESTIEAAITGILKSLGNSK